MDFPLSFFDDFLQHYEYVNIAYLETGVQPEQAPYVVMALITGIISTTAVGIDLYGQVHTGTTTFALRGEAAAHFYEQHLCRYDEAEPIVVPYALNDSWFRTCIFKLDSSNAVSQDGSARFTVKKICMVHDIIDEFVQHKMDDEEYRCYQEAMFAAVPLLAGYLSGDSDVSSHQPRSPGQALGFRKRIYAPYSL